MKYNTREIIEAEKRKIYSKKEILFLNLTRKFAYCNVEFLEVL